MADISHTRAFKPALLVVDVQEDFCPPASCLFILFLPVLLTLAQNGSLAVHGGRDIAPIVNKLLSLPFALKVATKDSHPKDHISFNTSHSAPNNKPFESLCRITNPLNSSESKNIPIWPVHCVQGTTGADIIPEIDASKFDIIVEKGRDPRLEMFSAFADIFGNKSDGANLDLAEAMKKKDISHIYVLGLAGDYCVRCSALDARKEGFEVYIVKEGTRSVDSGEKGWLAAEKEFQEAGIGLIGADGPQVHQVGTIRLKDED